MSENKPTQAKCAEIVDEYILLNPMLTCGITTLICNYSDSTGVAIFKIASEENIASHTIDVLFDHEVIYTRLVDAKPKCVIIPIFISEKRVEDVFPPGNLSPELLGGISRVYGINDNHTCSVVGAGEVLVFISFITQQCIVHNRNHLFTFAEDSDRIVALHHK